MQRVTISLEETLAGLFDALISESGYQSRSEAVRDLVRDAVDSQRLEKGGGVACVANLSYIYEHHVRDLANRLAEIGHDHHDLVLSTVQIPLDHETCFASNMLKGPVVAVRALANQILSERGVRFGKINVISVDPNDHHHGAGDHVHGGQAHLSPRPG